MFMTDEAAVSSALQSMLGSFSGPDSELVGKLCRLFRAWRLSPYPVDELTKATEDILFRFCYNAFGAGMRLPLADGGSRRIMLDDIKEKSEELISLPLEALPATRANFQTLYSEYMQTGSPGCLRALAKKYSGFLTEAEYRLITDILKENDPDFAASLTAAGPSPHRDRAKEEPHERTKGAQK